MEMKKLSDDALDMVGGGAALHGKNTVKGKAGSPTGEPEPIYSTEAFCDQCHKTVTFDVYSAGRAYCRPHHHFKQV